MRADQVVQRLKAWAAGRPLPAFSTIHCPIAPREDLLIVSFLRMGGESAPWAIGYGHQGRKPTVLTVPEARNRNLVADMVAEFAPILLQHFGHPDFSDNSRYHAIDAWPLRQIWLPNSTHVDMLHFLAYSYTFTKWGSASRAKLLNAFGRLAGWLFRESGRPGEVSVMVAAEMLRSSYVFPAEDVRQAHLGFLLAWLNTTGGRDKRLRAAQEAEQRSIATSLDPLIERDQLEPLVTRWNEAGARDNPRSGAREAAQIEKLLAVEIERRHNLVSQAIDVLKADKRSTNPGCDVLAQAALEEHWYQYLRLEHREDDADDGRAFAPSPETDLNPRAAASRYFVQEASDALRVGALVHYDAKLQEEAVAMGEGIHGRLIDVRDDSSTRATTPIWVLAIPDSGSLKVREGSWLCPVGIPKRTAIVRDVRRRGDKVEIELEVTGWKTAQSRAVPHAADSRLKGKDMTLVPVSDESLSRKKSRKVWNDDVAGAWLTHVRPAGHKARLDREVAEQNLGNVYVRGSRE